MVAKKRALRGLADLGIFIVEQNDEAGYKVGTKIPVSGAQQLTSQKEVDEWKIYADDGIYDVGVDWKGNKFTLQLADLPHELRVNFEGGTYDEITKEYTFSSSDNAPEIALSFSCYANADTKELTKIYSAKCSKISFDHRTKGDGNSITPVKIEGQFMERKIDRAIFTKKDATSAGISWLDSIDQLPVI